MAAVGTCGRQAPRERRRCSCCLPCHECQGGCLPRRDAGISWKAKPPGGGSALGGGGGLALLSQRNSSEAAQNHPDCQFVSCRGLFYF